MIFANPYLRQIAITIISEFQRQNIFLQKKERKKKTTNEK